MRYIIYIVPLIFVNFMLNGVVIAENATDSKSQIVGTIEDKASSLYAVIKLDGKKKLFIKGDILCSDKDITKCLRIEDIKKDTLVLKDVNDKDIIVRVQEGQRIPLEGSEIVFEGTVEPDIIEYRYKSSGELGGKDSVDFSLKEMDAKRIVLERSYGRDFSLASFSEEEKLVFARAISEESSGKTIKASFFENIEINKIGENEWVVNKESARKAFSNAGEVLVSVIKTVEPRYRFGEGLSLKFNCELGDVVLNKEGFLVQNLAVAALAERIGIVQGDIIKSINGQSVNTLYGIYKAYTALDSLSEDNIKAVKIDIVREGRPMTLIYNVR